MSRYSDLSQPSIRSLFAPLTMLLLATLVWGAASVAGADSHEAEVDASIKYRQKLMGAIGANMGAIADIMKYQLDLPGHVESHANQMAESARLIAPAFRKQVSEGPTDAKPEIWQEWSHFEEEIEEFQEAARALAQAMASKDGAAIGPAMKALGKTCGDCHDDFRKPKEESYKNQ